MSASSTLRKASLSNIANIMLKRVGASTSLFYAIGYTESAKEGALIQNSSFHALMK